MVSSGFTSVTSFFLPLLFPPSVSAPPTQSLQPLDLSSGLNSFEAMGRAWLNFVFPTFLKLWQMFTLKA